MSNKNLNAVKRIGAKLAYIRKRGQANVTINTVIKIADALDIEIKELFDFTL